MKFRVWLTNDFYPNGIMYYRGLLYDNNATTKFGLLLNTNGDLVMNVPQPPESCGLEELTNHRMVWARIGLNSPTIMMSSECDDKNGKDIYEGDIIKIDLPSERTYRKLVVWKGSAFWCREIGGIGAPLMKPLFGFASQAIEVVGNEHENPELLK